MDEAKETSGVYKIHFADCDPLGHLNNVKYVEYMLNAREDHVEERYGFTFDSYIKKTGCIWVAVENKISYLREVKSQQNVRISSKIIEIDDRTMVVEVLMTDLENKIVNAVLWLKVIYFNMKTRRAEKHSQKEMSLFSEDVCDLEQKDFDERTLFLRNRNKIINN